MGTPFFLKAKNDSSAVMEMGTYVNPDLTNTSEYFKSLDAMMSCVQKNAHVTDAAAQEKVCASEYKNMRLAALE